MRKTLIIIAVGAIIALFPLLALPPRMEAWILLVIGLSIIIFGLYERIVHTEKHSQDHHQKRSSLERPQTSIDEKLSNEEQRFEEDKSSAKNTEYDEDGEEREHLNY
jgi:membrane protein implicated in regulation of membrane protease activity